MFVVRGEERGDVFFAIGLCPLMSGESQTHRETNKRFAAPPPWFDVMIVRNGGVAAER
jgi:hypothetical protein